MRLRARLLLLIGAALLPAVAVQVDFERQTLAARAEAERSEAMRLARLVSADLESVIEGARQFLAAVGNVEMAATGDQQACDRSLAALLRDVPHYTTLTLTDAAGRITCSALPGGVGQDISARAFFSRAQQAGRFTIGEHAVGYSSGMSSLHFAQPLTQDRHGRDGMVIAALDLDWLARRLADIPLPPGGTASVVDRAGIILGRWPEPERFVGERATPGMLQAIAAGGFDVRSGIGIDGVRRTYAVVPIGAGPPAMSVAIGLDSAQAEAALAGVAHRGLLLILGGGLCALALGFLVAWRSMERPVEALLATMDRWRAGDLRARASGDPRLGRRNPSGEFQRIAAAFDQAAEAVEAREVALRESEARLSQIGDATEDVILITEPARQRVVYASAAFARLSGLPQAAAYTGFDAGLSVVHPDDQATLRALISQPPEIAFEAEYRVRRGDGTERRVRQRRFPVPGSSTGRAVVVVSDVTEEREAAERQILLAREVDHRAKNVLAVVQSVLRLTRADSPRAFARAVEGRVAALARAHQLLARSRWDGADLVELLGEEFAPYTARGRGRTRGGERCLLDGPPLRLGPEAVQPFAMVAHELATNSAKHGALSVPGGLLRITWHLAPREPGGAAWLQLSWVESGGPPVPGAPQRFGFGSRVVAATVERQLGGEVRFDWAPEGLHCTVMLPAGRVLQSHAAEPADAVPERPAMLSGRPGVVVSPRVEAAPDAARQGALG